MSLPQTQGWKIEGNDCTFFMKQVDPQTKNVLIAAVVLAALSAIVLLGNVLLILAQQGHALGGINALAANCHPVGLYVGVAVTSILFTLSIALVSTIIRSYKQQVFSREEFEELQLLPNLQATNIDIPNKHYSTFISLEKPPTETEKGCPAVYACVSKDDAGQVTVVPFTKETALEAYISKLETLEYFPVNDTHTEGRISITDNNIHDFTDEPAWLKKKCAILAKGLPDNCYAYERVQFPKMGACHTHFLFALRLAANKIDYFLAQNLGQDDVEEYTAKFLGEFVDVKKALAAVKIAQNMYINQSLEKSNHLSQNNYVNYTTTLEIPTCMGEINDGNPPTKTKRTIYITTYKECNSVDSVTKFFLTEEERTKRLTELLFFVS